MKLRQTYDIISRLTDTLGQEINVSETKRVLAVYHSLLAELPTSEAFSIVGQGIAEAEKKKSKAQDALRRKIKAAIKKA